MRIVEKNKNIIPGVYRVWVLPTSYIKSYIKSDLSGDVKITLHDPNLPVLLNTAIDSITASIASVNSDAGTSYRVSIRGFIPGTSEVNQNMMVELSKQKFVVILKSYDNIQRSVGNPDIPLDFTFNEIYSPRLGYEVTLSGETTNTLNRTVMQYNIGVPIVIPDDPPDENYTITVYVMDENQINGIENAVVQLVNGFSTYEATNSLGVAVFNEIPNGTYALTVSKNGYIETGLGVIINGSNVSLTFILYTDT